MGWTGLDAHPTWHSLLGPPAAQWWMWCCDQAPGRDSLPPLTLLVCFRRKLRLVGTQSWEVLKVSESSKMSMAMRTNYRLYWVICWQNMFCAFKKCLCSTCVYHIWDDDSQTNFQMCWNHASVLQYTPEIPQEVCKVRGCCGLWQLEATLKPLPADLLGLRSLRMIPRGRTCNSNGQ